MIGFVYILVNEYMPDVYKVGCTERSPHERAAELSKPTGVPSPFEVLCYAEFEDFQSVERDMHEWLSPHRISANREFFHFGLEYAVRLLWWHRKRLSFTEPGPAGDVPLVKRDVLWFDGLDHLMQTTDPWEKKPPDTSPFDNDEIPAGFGEAANA